MMRLLGFCSPVVGHFEVEAALDCYLARQTRRGSLKLTQYLLAHFLDTSEKDMLHFLVFEGATHCFL